MHKNSLVVIGNVGVRLKTVCNLRLTGPEIPAFRALDFVY